MGFSIAMLNNQMVLWVEIVEVLWNWQRAAGLSSHVEVLRDFLENMSCNASNRHPSWDERVWMMDAIRLGADRQGKSICYFILPKPQSWWENQVVGQLSNSLLHSQVFAWNPEEHPSGPGEACFGCGNGLASSTWLEILVAPWRRLYVEWEKHRIIWANQVELPDDDFPSGN